MGITNRYYTLAYLQGNGQAEAVNKVIVSGLKVEECPVGISNHTLQINGGDLFLDDIQSRGCYSIRNGLSHAEN